MDRITRVYSWTGDVGLHISLNVLLYCRELIGITRKIIVYYFNIKHCNYWTIGCLHLACQRFVYRVVTILWGRILCIIYIMITVHMVLTDCDLTFQGSFRKEVTPQPTSRYRLIDEN